MMLYTKQVLIASGAVHPFRICPWDSTNTHIPATNRVRWHAEIESGGLATATAEVWVLNETRDAGGALLLFNPSDVMRQLDRDDPDNIFLVDENNAPVIQSSSGGPANWGFMAWAGSKMMTMETPAWTIDADQTNRAEFFLRVGNPEPVDVLVNVRIFAELI